MFEDTNVHIHKESKERADAARHWITGPFPGAAEERQAKDRLLTAAPGAPDVDCQSCQALGIQQSEIYVRNNSEFLMKGQKRKEEKVLAFRIAFRLTDGRQRTEVDPTSHPVCKRRQGEGKAKKAAKLNGGMGLKTDQEQVLHAQSLLTRERQRTESRGCSIRNPETCLAFEPLLPVCSPIIDLM